MTTVLHVQLGLMELKNSMEKHPDWPRILECLRGMISPFIEVLSGPSVSWIQVREASSASSDWLGKLDQIKVPSKGIFMPLLHLLAQPISEVEKAVDTFQRRVTKEQIRMHLDLLIQIHALFSPPAVEVKAEPEVIIIDLEALSIPEVPAVPWLFDVPDQMELDHQEQVITPDTMEQTLVMISIPVSPELPFPCSKCDKAFSRANGLAHHMMVHRTEAERKANSHLCSKCEKTFVNQGNLTMHMKSHRREEPLRTADAMELDTLNAEVIPEEQPLEAEFDSETEGQVVNATIVPAYKCPNCKRDFARRVNLVQHMVTHLDPAERESHPCPECSKNFKHRRNLDRHMGTSHNQELTTISNKRKADGELARLFKKPRLDTTQLKVAKEIRGNKRNLFTNKLEFLVIWEDGTDSSEPIEHLVGLEDGEFVVNEAFAKYLKNNERISAVVQSEYSINI